MGDAVAIASALLDVGIDFEQRGDITSDSVIGVIDTSSLGTPAAVEAIRLAAQACLDGRADAMVTGPIHKAKLIEQGFEHMGHTDMLGDICGVPPVMAFVGGAVRVALVTTHIPLSDVPTAITYDNVCHAVRTAHHALQHQLKMDTSRMVLCGLNPHAGESGRLGDCERSVLTPAVSDLRAEGIDVIGPVSAETAFMEAVKGRFDMVVAMYHDQGLVPLKALSFGESVNWTIGLPLVRTSVDHGTADDLVGTGKADPASMKAAIDLAMQIVRA